MASSRHDDMLVPGKMKGSSKLSCDSSKLSCDPCKDVDNDIPAAGFCEDCGIYLCTLCYNYHTKLKALKNHQLLDKANMPRDTSHIKVKDVCVDKCPSHTDKVIEYFCESCDQLGCSACIIKSHRPCRKVHPIPDIVKDMAHNKDYDQITATIEGHSKQLSSLTNRYKLNMNVTEALRNTAKQAIKSSSDEVCSYVRKLEHEMDEKVEKIYTADKNQLSVVSTTISSLETELQNMSSNLEEKKKGGLNCQLFVALQNAKKDTILTEKSLHQLENLNTVKRYQFQMASRIMDLTEQEKELGKLEENSNDTQDKVMYPFDIPLKFTDRDGSLDPAGMCLMSEDRILVVCNNDIRVIDINKKMVATVTAVASRPWDVTKVSKEQIAVTFPEIGKVKIYTLSSVNTLSETRIIDVGKGCYGIRHSNETFFVTYSGTHSGSVKKLDMSGNVLQEFKIHSRDKTMFQCPYFLDLSPVKQFLYVSDASDNTVTCMTFHGEVKTVHQCEGSSTYGVTVKTDGSMYLCYHCSGQVEHLSEQCELLQKLPIKIESYRSAVFYEKTRCLFVSFDGYPSGIRVLAIQ